ncbi:MAG: YopX family protein [Candidatus Thorarchaeota archaeon]
MGNNLKFRMWSDSLKVMYTPDNQIGHLWSIPESPNGILTPKEGDTLMIFTGMTDNNGVEIYEGDILKVHKFIEVLGENMGASEGELEFIAEVQYLNVGIFLNTTKIAYDDITYSDFVVCMEGLHEESFEVIGNKFEHDYLLSGGN